MLKNVTSNVSKNIKNCLLNNQIKFSVNKKYKN